MSGPDVAGFYDRATRGFLALGHGGKQGIIHRAVWGPGVTTRARALRFAEDQIAARCPERARLLDLGCGVGSSLAYLADAVPHATGVGVTLSEAQVQHAAALLAERRLDDRLACRRGDFTDIDHPSDQFDVAYAIEAFVHGPDPDAFFAEAARLLAPGGRLMVVDDMLSDRGANAQGRDAALLDRFIEGWHIQTLITRDAMVAAAGRAGFQLTSTRDWTRWVELRRPRDRAITLGVALTRHLPIRHPWWASMRGGDALQHALLAGLLQYRFTVFDLDAARTGP